MDSNLRRGLVAEFLGTFAVVYFSVGVVCVNALTTPASAAAPPALQPGQPGLAGIAWTHGLIFAAALAVTLPLSTGFLNPAITLMLWVFNRIDNQRTGLLLATQLAASVAAATCLRFTIDDSVLRDCRMGSPHLNVAAFPSLTTSAIVAGTAAELLLTFFLIFAIFGIAGDTADKTRLALPAGMVLVAGTVVLGPLTGAAANPARWFGPVLWEQLLPDRTGPSPWGDTFVFLAGPIVGALVSGWVVFRFLRNESPIAELPPVAGSPGKAAAQTSKRK